MANERLKELEIEINAKIAEANSIAAAVAEPIILKIGPTNVNFDGYDWTFGGYDWYSSSVDC